MQVAFNDPFVQIWCAIAVLAVTQVFFAYVLYKKGFITRQDAALYLRIVSSVLPYWGQAVAKNLLNDFTHFFAQKWKVSLFEKVSDFLEEKLEELKKLEEKAQTSQTTRQEV